MSIAQLKVAHTLAAALGHRWGGVDIGLFAAAATDGLITPEDVERFVLGQEDPDEEPVFPPGILCPRLDDHGRVEHGSRSGTISWLVERDGSATLTLWCRSRSDFAARVYPALVSAVARLAASGVTINVQEDWTWRDPREDAPGSPEALALEAAASDPDRSEAAGASFERLALGRHAEAEALAAFAPPARAQ